MRFRPSLWLTISAVVAFAILCGLGIWQLQRLEWKQGLLVQIDARMTADAVPLPARPEDLSEWRFRRVTVAGRFRHDAEAHRTGKVENGQIGYRVFTPLEREDGAGVVMVERGWVPEPLKDPEGRAPGQVAGVVTVTGVLRLPDERNNFTPADDPEANLWFASDPVAMAAAAGLAAPAFYVVSEQSDSPWPRAGKPELNVKNDHLEYAMTWFSLAAVLAVIWLLMGLRRGRETT